MRRYFFGLAMMALAMMAPAIARADDSQIARQIIERLQVEKRAGNLKGFNIDLQVDEGTVWMSGKLATEEQRIRALEIARRIPGVKQVVNDLKVAGASQDTADASIPSDDAKSPSMLTNFKSAYWTGRKTDSDSSEVKPASGVVGTGVTAGAVQAAPAPYYAPTARPTPTATPLASGSVQPTSANRNATPVPMGYANLRQTQYEGQVVPEGGPAGPNGEPCPMYSGPGGAMRYDQPNMPCYSWPSYAAYPNYAAVTYPKQYSPTVWPYIGPFYPYPQVPMGWRKVTLEWDDGWWFLDFKDSRKVAHGRW